MNYENYEQIKLYAQTTDDKTLFVTQMTKFDKPLIVLCTPYFTCHLCGFYAELHN